MEELHDLTLLPPQRVHATDKEQTAASLFAGEIIHLKQKSRDFIAAEIGFPFKITAGFWC